MALDCTTWVEMGISYCSVPEEGVAGDFSMAQETCALISIRLLIKLLGREASAKGLV